MGTYAESLPMPANMLQVLVRPSETREHRSLSRSRSSRVVAKHVARFPPFVRIQNTE